MNPVPTFETIIAEVHDRVAVLTLNRPQALNALNSTMMREPSRH